MNGSNAGNPKDKKRKEKRKNHGREEPRDEHKEPAVGKEI